jgi:hypothetical protein
MFMMQLFSFPNENIYIFIQKNVQLIIESV